MIDQRHCPFCSAPAVDECPHLALAVEARDFVRQCVELCHGQAQWRVLSNGGQGPADTTGGWSARQADYTWLESAFRDEFLHHLKWFGGMDYEWRSGPKPGQGGFWVLLWSKEPKQLWWELREELERKTIERSHSHDTPPWLIWMSPR